METMCSCCQNVCNNYNESKFELILRINQSEDWYELESDKQFGSV